jgi:predicted ArsR family transcriptional regulator
MSRNPHRDDRGQFDSELTDENILAYFEEDRPFRTAREVADRFDVDRSTAYRRLSKLTEESQIEKVTLGERTVVWWYRAESESEFDGYDADDPLFSGPTITADDPVEEEEIDDVLYGEVEK